MEKEIDIEKIKELLEDIGSFNNVCQLFLEQLNIAEACDLLPVLKVQQRVINRIYYMITGEE